jgi:hypothetical protein
VRILPPDVNRSGAQHHTEAGACEQSKRERRMMSDEVREGRASAPVHHSSLINRTSVGLRSYGPYLVRGRVEQNHRAIGITADWLDMLN